MKASKHCGAHGFTLVEVLVALSVFSIGIMALFHLRGESVRSLAALEERAIAQIVAENRMIEAQQFGVPIIIGLKSGEADMAGRSWAWSEETTETPDAGLRRIQVSVRAAESESVLAEIIGFHDAN